MHPTCAGLILTDTLLLQETTLVLGNQQNSNNSNSLKRACFCLDLSVSPYYAHNGRVHVLIRKKDNTIASTFSKNKYKVKH